MKFQSGFTQPFLNIEPTSSLTTTRRRRRLTPMFSTVVPILSTLDSMVYRIQFTSPFIYFMGQSSHPRIRLSSGTRSRRSHFFQSSTLTDQRFGGDARFQMTRTGRRWGLLSRWGGFQGHISQFLGREGNGDTGWGLSFFFPEDGVLPLLGVSDGVGGRIRRRRPVGVASTGGCGGGNGTPSGLATRTMRRIHLLKAGVNNSCPFCASSSAINGCVCN